MIVGSRRGKRLADLATYAVVGLFLVFALGPLFWLLVTSLKPETDIVTADGVRYWPSRLTLEHYGAIWAQTDFPTLFKNSLITTVVTILLAWPAAPSRPMPSPGSAFAAGASSC